MNVMCGVDTRVPSSDSDSTESDEEVMDQNRDGYHTLDEEEIANATV
jgi:hypothetical protein